MFSGCVYVYDTVVLVTFQDSSTFGIFNDGIIRIRKDVIVINETKNLQLFLILKIKYNVNLSKYMIHIFSTTSFSLITFRFVEVKEKLLTLQYYKLKLEFD